VDYWQGERFWVSVNVSIRVTREAKRERGTFLLDLLRKWVVVGKLCRGDTHCHKTHKRAGGG